MIEALDRLLQRLFRSLGASRAERPEPLARTYRPRYYSHRCANGEDKVLKGVQALSGLRTDGEVRRAGLLHR